jgi:hypothetical protein
MRKTNFGMSALSKSNKSVAYKDEIMCNKNIGEMCVNTSDNDTMSYNYFARIYTSINTIMTSATAHSIKGDASLLIPDDMELPAQITNTIPTNITIDDNIKGIILYVDIYAVMPVENILTKLTIDKIIVSYNITTTNTDGSSSSYNINETVQDMVDHYIKFDKDTSSVSISDITVEVDPDIIVPTVLTLNNVVMFISK